MQTRDFRILLCLLGALLIGVSSRRGLCEDAKQTAETVAHEVAFPSAALVGRLIAHGLVGTHESTILSLLPRELPARMTGKEMAEFERRVNNLGIFDSVTVRYDERLAALMVDVREKFTLTPSADFASGQTLADMYLMLGLTEYNLFGRGTRLSGEASLAERRPNADLYFAEHPFAARSFALAANAYYESSSLRFDSGDGWHRNRSALVVSVRPPYTYGTPLRYELSALYMREANSNVQGTVLPADGHVIRTGLEIFWDQYTWRDLSASGASFSIKGVTGGFFPAGEARHLAVATFTSSIAPTETTAIMLRLNGTAVTAGNVNHSALLGSLEGVRGLDDAFYRNQLQAYANLELRQAWRFASRWALQGVLFSDGAVFRPFDARGQPMPVQSALGVGGGIRLIPTFLTRLLLRIDAGTLVYPDPHFFYQLGFSQYF